MDKKTLLLWKVSIPKRRRVSAQGRGDPSIYSLWVYRSMIYGPLAGNLLQHTVSGPASQSLFWEANLFLYDKRYRVLPVRAYEDQ